MASWPTPRYLAACLGDTAKGTRTVQFMSLSAASEERASPLAGEESRTLNVILVGNEVVVVSSILCKWGTNRSATPLTAECATAISLTPCPPGDAVLVLISASYRSDPDDPSYIGRTWRSRLWILSCAPCLSPAGREWLNWALSGSSDLKGVSRQAELSPVCSLADLP